MHFIRFHQANALRFKTIERFHIIWSAGLFDYLRDAMFVRLLKVFLQHCLPGGEIVVGNFGEHNPSRNYMELLGGWKLIHRGRDQLIALSKLAGVSAEHVRVDQEPEGVNLFLHIRMPSLQKS
jgi:SAM-dependent methyltransferase